jgi:hypothetical protein
MREHGVDFPDPTFESGGRVRQTGPDKDTPPEKLRDAENACHEYDPEEIQPPQLSDEQRQEFKEAALANARCMREHGIENFPDPTFGEDGRPEVMIKKGSGIDPDDPDFKAAEKACEDTLPKPSSEESAP